MTYRRGAGGVPSKMPFGAYKDEPLTNLKVGYINWLLHDFKGLRPPLKAALEAELHRRGTSDASAAAQADRDESRPHPRPSPTRPAGTEPMAESAHPMSPAPQRPVANRSQAEAKVRAIVRQELAALFKRVVLALERDGH